MQGAKVNDKDEHWSMLIQNVWNVWKEKKNVLWIGWEIYTALFSQFLKDKIM